jgi:hypothetical protein
MALTIELVLHPMVRFPGQLFRLTQYNRAEILNISNEKRGQCFQIKLQMVGKQ